MYKRMLPRDLFNEANLLKCYGSLYLQLERFNLQGCVRHTETHEHGGFAIRQFPADGSTTVVNIEFITPNGACHVLWRPLNSRSPYPLKCEPCLFDDKSDSESVDVFDADGSLSTDFMNFLIKHGASDAGLARLYHRKVSSPAPRTSTSEQHDD